METGHGEAITGYDIEAETHYRPGVWKSIMTGKTQNQYLGSGVVLDCIDS